MADDDLKLCVHCGEDEAALQVGRIVFVECMNCGSRGPVELMPHRAIESEAIGIVKKVTDGWNTRKDWAC